MSVFITDCEGPISKNDNAMELTAAFVPRGEVFFALLSKYDDYLAYVEKRPGYKAGDTLRLIVPFLKAFDATDARIEEYSREHILLMPGAAETLRHIRSMMPAYIISTSYEPYIKALCKAINFPFENVYCTKLEIDRYPLPRDEQGRLRKLAEEISGMSMIEWDEGADGLGDLPAQARTVVSRLNALFWGEISRMRIGGVLNEVDPIGGERKATAVQDILQRTGDNLSSALYVGDSITDLQALKLVKEGGGLAVSFNGNSYAIEGAQVVCVGNNTDIISALAGVFVSEGTSAVLSMLLGPDEGTSRVTGFHERLAVYMSRGAIGCLSAENQALWTEKSRQFRREVRGVAIGSLG